MVRNRQDRPTPAPARIAAAAGVVQQHLGLPGGCVGVAFVDDAEMEMQHGRFSGDPSRTDVLSFPDELGRVAGSWPVTPAADEPPYWGDVIVCTDQARRQAHDLCHPYTYELLVLVLHGFLHLAGFDHTTDGGRMTRIEERLRPLCSKASSSWI
jgi:probable rRNA maturation factor